MDCVSLSEPKLPLQVLSKGKAEISVALDEPNKGGEAVLVVCERKGKFWREYRRKGDPKST